jgi:hypothetical protein
MKPLHPTRPFNQIRQRLLSQISTTRQLIPVLTSTESMRVASAPETKHAPESMRLSMDMTQKSKETGSATKRSRPMSRCSLRSNADVKRQRIEDKPAGLALKDQLMDRKQRTKGRILLLTTPLLGTGAESEPMTTKKTSVMTSSLERGSQPRTSSSPGISLDRNPSTACLLSLRRPESLSRPTLLTSNMLGGNSQSPMTLQACPTSSGTVSSAGRQSTSTMSSQETCPPSPMMLPLTQWEDQTRSPWSSPREWSRLLETGPSPGPPLLKQLSTRFPTGVKKSRSTRSGFKDIS